jgi:hypothetical protein
MGFTSFNPSYDTDGAFVLRCQCRRRLRQSDARHLTAALSEKRHLCVNTKQALEEDSPMKKQISIALAAIMLIAGASIASATEMSRKVAPPAKHSTQSQQTMKGQQHAAVRAPWHNAD